MSSSGSTSSRRVRLQRVLAEAGVAARKQCERLIETGHVEVNGERVEKLPVFVDPDADEIRVDGRLIKPVTRHIYLMWHKPSRVLATPPADDLDTRPSVSDYVDHPTAPRLFPVGTLGFEASGLMLLTSSTKAATLLSHPRSRVERLYHARVKGTPTGTVRSKLNKGVQVLVPERGKEPPGAEKPPVRTMERGAKRPHQNKPTMRRVRMEIRALDPSKRNADGQGFLSESDPRRAGEGGGGGWAGGGGGGGAGNSSIEILTSEPRDEYVAQALHLVGHPVRKMLRLGIGPLRLREVGPGAWRELSRDEMRALRTFLDELSGEGKKSGSVMGASRGPGKRRPRVVGGSKAPDSAPAKKAPGRSDQQSEASEEPGVDPEDFQE
ncbi:MAG: S4 domain-containing protein [Phycisphaerales bacterium]